MSFAPRGRVAALVAVAALGVGAVACGKKGPPLAPIVRLPAAAEPFTARRLASTVYLQFAIPSKNRDNSTPADIGRVEVYGFTGTPETDEDLVKYGKLVASVLVRRPPPPEEEDRPRGKQPSSKPARPKPPPEPEPGFEQGATVTIVETLTPELLKPTQIERRDAKKKKGAETEANAPVLLPLVTSDALPVRTYVAVGVSRKGHKGAFSRRAGIPTLDAPQPPSDLKLSHTETAILLQWSPAVGAALTPVSPLPGDEQVLPYKALVPLGGPTWSYEVFDAPAAKDAAPSPPASARPPAMPPVAPPDPLNKQPLTTPSFTDNRIEFGTERCYVVRTIEAFGTMREGSEASAPACITPRDIYPPAPPKGLAAVVAGGSISLIWDPNSEGDLAGYLVLRAEAPNGTLQPLTPDPIHETTYNDTTGKPGVRYVYAVVAVDKSKNVSAQSNKVEETAR